MQTEYTDLNLGDVLSRTCKVYIKHFIDIMIVTLIVYIPMNLLLYCLSSDNYGFRSSSTYYRLAQLLEGLFGIIAGFAIIFITAKALDGEELHFSKALKLSVQNWGAGILTNIVRGIILFGLTLLLIVPGVIWLVYYTFSDQAVTLGQLRYKEALDYSKSLVKGDWWRTVGYSIIIVMIPVILTLTISYSITFLTNSYYGIEPLQIVVNTVTDIISAFATVGITVFYMELQKHKQTNLPIPTFYEKMNSIVNKDSQIDDTPDAIPFDENGETVMGEDGAENVTQNDMSSITSSFDDTKKD